jgi:putative hydrolase of the HAD superfamily
MKYILWDFDGTLGYRDGMWSGTLYSLLSKNNITNISLENIEPYLDRNSLEKMRPYLGKNFTSKGLTWHFPEQSHKELFGTKTWLEYYAFHFKNIFQELGLDETISKKMSKEVINEFMDMAKWHLFNDVIDTFNNLDDNIYQNIIVSNHVPELEKIIEGLNIKNYFHGIYSSGNIGYEKPNPKIYEYVLKDKNIDKTDCIIIGDNYDADITGGLNMGIKSILVRVENTNNYEYYSKNFKDIIQKINDLKYGGTYEQYRNFICGDCSFFGKKNRKTNNRTKQQIVSKI